MKLTRTGLFTTIIVVAALFLGSKVVQLIPSAEQQFGRPFEHHATLGEPVELRTGTVTVTGVDTAKEVVSFGDVGATTAIWLVVELEWVTTKQPAGLNLSGIQLHATDGRTYGGVPPITAACLPGQPHLGLVCSYPIELPSDALEGAVLHIPALLQSSHDDVAVVDLGIDAGLAAKLGLPKDQIELKISETKP